MHTGKFNIITLFPEYFNSIFTTSLMKKAIEKNIIHISTIDLKEFGIGKHNKVDDHPYGGGNGMIIMIEPVYNALKSIKEKTYSILLTPTGEVFCQEKAKELSKIVFPENKRKTNKPLLQSAENEYESITFICGRYEGVDARVGEHLCNKQISIGNYIVCGGEVAAAVVIEATSRIMPGFMSNIESIKDESFSIEGEEDKKEYPQYTRPQNFCGYKVPEILLSGNHQEIKKWREDQQKSSY